MTAKQAADFKTAIIVIQHRWQPETLQSNWNNSSRIEFGEIQLSTW